MLLGAVPYVLESLLVAKLMALAVEERIRVPAKVLLGQHWLVDTE